MSDRPRNDKPKVARAFAEKQKRMRADRKRRHDAWGGDLNVRINDAAERASRRTDGGPDVMAGSGSIGEVAKRARAEDRRRPMGGKPIQVLADAYHSRRGAK